MNSVSNIKTAATLFVNQVIPTGLEMATLKLQADYLHELLYGSDSSYDTSDIEADSENEAIMNDIINRERPEDGVLPQRQLRIERPSMFSEPIIEYI